MVRGPFRQGNMLENPAAQSRELSDLGAKGRELRARVKELSDALEKEQAANALISGELQVLPWTWHAGHYSRFCGGK